MALVELLVIICAIGGAVILVIGLSNQFRRIKHGPRKGGKRSRFGP